MFKKDDIMSLIDDFSLDCYDYKVIMGGSLVMRGIKESTNDLDLNVDHDAFYKLADMFDKRSEIRNVNGQKRFAFWTMKGEVEVYLGTFRTDHGMDVYDEIEYVRCQTLGDIVSMKRAFGREKDFDDIIMIERWVLQNS